MDVVRSYPVLFSYFWNNSNVSNKQMILCTIGNALELL